MINNFEEEVLAKRNKLKKDIKITSGKCAKMLLILGIMTQIILIAIVMIVGRKGEIFGLSTQLNRFLISFFPCILVNVIVIIIGMKITSIKIKRDMFCKNESSLKFIILASIACIGAGLASGLIYLIYSSILQWFGITIPQPDFSLPKEEPFALTLMLGYICILGPILEEIIFRGFILKSMQKYGNVTAIIVTSILFGMFHLNLVQLVPPILMGMVLAIITIKSKSIIPSIIAHIMNNSVSTMLSSLEGQSILVQGIVSTLYISIAISGLIFFVKLYGKQIIKMIKDKSRILKTRQKVLIAFSGGWSITYIIFYLVMILAEILITNIYKL